MTKENNQCKYWPHTSNYCPACTPIKKTPQKLEEIEAQIFQLVGEASMCWDNIDKATFDSASAEKVGKAILSLFSIHISEAEAVGYERGGEAMKKSAIEAILKKARITDYADRTEYDECAELIKALPINETLR